MKNGRKTVLALFAAALLALCGCDAAGPLNVSGGSYGSDDAPSAAERTKLLYASVEVLSDREASPLLSRPADCPQEIGPALGTMLSLYEAEPDRLYHVAFCLNAVVGREDREAVAGKLRTPDALFADEWVSLSDVAAQKSGGEADGWFYYLFTADEIRALASVGLQCRFVGSGESLSADGLTQKQAIEHICQFSGDAFRASRAETP